MDEIVERNPNFRLVFIAVLVGLIGAIAGISLWTLSHKPAHLEVVTLLPEPRSIADFTLLDQDGQPWSKADLRGRWSLMFFGFTNCPDVCPNTLFELQRVEEILDSKLDGEPAGHQVVFVSVDPQRDTPEKLGKYVEYFNPDFVGVTGEAEQIRALTSELGIAYELEEPSGAPDSYNVLHSTAIVLMNPDGELQGAFTAPHFAEKMAADLEALVY